jgi:hypothetical protein
MADSNITQLTSLMISPNTNADTSNYITVIPGSNSNEPTIELEGADGTNTTITSSGITLQDTEYSINSNTESIAITSNSIVLEQDTISNNTINTISSSVVTLNDNIHDTNTTIESNSITLTSPEGDIVLTPGNTTAQTLPTIVAISNSYTSTITPGSITLFNADKGITLTSGNTAAQQFPAMTMSIPPGTGVGNNSTTIMYQGALEQIIYILPTALWPNAQINDTATLQGKLISTENAIYTVQLQWQGPTLANNNPDQKSKKN